MSLLEVNSQVIVEGSPNQNGIGHIVEITQDDDGQVDYTIKFALGIKEKHVEARFVSPHSYESVGKRRRVATAPLKERKPNIPAPPVATKKKKKTPVVAATKPHKPEEKVAQALTMTCPEKPPPKVDENELDLFRVQVSELMNAQEQVDLYQVLALCENAQDLLQHLQNEDAVFVSENVVYRV